tara:strand:+ start:810 stop:1070 length:261 start_codon:yes stop_codon:yes gene_type:complete
MQDLLKSLIWKIGFNMGFTKELLEEMESFDYGSLFNQELEYLEDALEDSLEAPQQVYHKAVTIDVSGSMQIHLNRLEQLIEEETKL